MIESDAAQTTLAHDVVSSLLENFDCQPVLFVGAGLARRYIDAPDWEGALRMVLSDLPEPKPTYEYLFQKFGGNKILIGSELANAVFEWAWKDRDDMFPPRRYLHPQTSLCS